MSSQAVQASVVPIGLRARRRAVYRADLQAIAVELCLEFGYDAVSTRRIADAAGVSESTLFRSFGSKAGLVCNSPFVPLLMEALALPLSQPSVSVNDAVRRALIEVSGSITPEQWRGELRRRELIRRVTELQAASSIELEAARDTVLGWVRARVGASVDPATLSAYVVFMVAGFTSLSRSDIATPEEWGRGLLTIVDLIATGIHI